MLIDKLSLLRVFSFTCSFGKRVYYENLLRRLEIIEANFLKPNIKFKDNVWDLYDCLTRVAKTPVEEDLPQFRYVDIALSTKSSERALAYLESLLDGGKRIRREDCFKTTSYFNPVNLLSWYSNLYSFMLFYEKGVAVLGLWCYVNPKNEKGVALQTQTVTTLLPPLLEFLSSRDFKFILNDLIIISKFILERNLGLLNGQES